MISHFYPALKGVTGNIGATALVALAMQLETALKERQTHPQIEVLLQQLATPPDNLIRHLNVI